MGPTDPISKSGVVVFLDALGVRHLGIEESREFCKKRNSFIERVKWIRDQKAPQFKRDLDIVLPDPEISIFQDSIVICWEEEISKQRQDNYHFDFFQAAGQWLIDAMNCAIGMKLFFRGSISHGDYVSCKSDNSVTVIGPAITDAHDFCEGTKWRADWIGVIQTRQCTDKYLSKMDSIAKIENTTREGAIDHFNFLFVPYRVPLSNETKEDFFAVSWPRLTYSIYDKGGYNILKILSDEANRPKNAKHRSKYDNSLAFAQWYKYKFMLPPE